jgi:opacity protein-like surface antigen
MREFGKSLAIMLAAASAMFAVAGAEAADMAVKAPRAPALAPAPAPMWYVAARLGVADLSQRDVDYTNPRVFATVGGSDNDTMKFVGAAALGMQLPSMPIRLEVEYAYRSKANFSRDTLGFCPAPCAGFAPVNGLNFNGYNAIQYQSQTLMLNGYWDIPVVQRVAVFVGAGVGVSFNRTSATQVATVTFTAPDPVAIPPGVLAPFASWPERTSTTLAWSATTGVSIDVTANFAVDMSYRFVSLGRYDTGINPNLFQDERFRATVYSQEALLGGRLKF